MNDSTPEKNSCIHWLMDLTSFPSFKGKIMIYPADLSVSHKYVLFVMVRLLAVGLRVSVRVRVRVRARAHFS